MLKCVNDRVEVLWNLVFIGVKCSCGSIFVEVGIAFADNSWLIDNSRELVDNVRDKL